MHVDRTIDSISVNCIDRTCVVGLGSFSSPVAVPRWGARGVTGIQSWPPNLAVLLTHCGQLILKKVSKSDAIRCQILRLKCTRFDFCWGSAPDPSGGTYSAPPDPLAVFKAPTSEGRAEKREGRERKEGEGNRRGNEWMEGERPAFPQIFWPGPAPARHTHIVHGFPQMISLCWLRRCRAADLRWCARLILLSRQCIAAAVAASASATGAQVDVPQCVSIGRGHTKWTATTVDAAAAAAANIAITRQHSTSQSQLLSLRSVSISGKLHKRIRWDASIFRRTRTCSGLCGRCCDSCAIFRKCVIDQILNFVATN